MIMIFIYALVLCIAALVLAYNAKFSQRQTIWLYIVLVIALAGIGACLEPKSIYDLFRHYQAIERVRSSSMSFYEFLKDGYWITDSNYKYTYVFNTLVYIIARFLPNEALTVISIIVTYGSFGYIFFREFTGAKIDDRYLLISISIFSVLMPYLFVYSNIRNAFAGAIVAVGIYKLYRDRTIVFFGICSIIAVLIHPVSAAVIPFIFLSKIKPGLKGIIVTFAVPSVVLPVMEFVSSRLGSDFLTRITFKYHNYTLVRVDNQGRVYLYSTVIMLIALAVLALWSKKNVGSLWKDREYLLLNHIIWYSMFSLGYFRNYEMMMRLPYSIAFLSPVVVSTLFNKEKMNSFNARTVYVGATGIVFVLALLGLYENIAWLI